MRASPKLYARDFAGVALFFTTGYSSSLSASTGAALPAPAEAGRVYSATAHHSPLRLSHASQRSFQRMDPLSLIHI